MTDGGGCRARTGASEARLAGTARWHWRGLQAARCVISVGATSVRGGVCVDSVKGGVCVEELFVAEGLHEWRGVRYMYDGECGTCMMESAVHV